MRVADMILAGGMLISGTLNTISSKFQDEVSAPGVDPKPHSFEHPVVQTLAMFLGELLCLIAFKLLVTFGKKTEKNQPANFPAWVFLLPSLCDMTGSTLMYIGLLLTYASVFQMLRGMIVVFTGVFSFFFLKRKLYGYHWLGMALITIGTFLVGLSSVLYGSAKPAKNPVLGDILVVGAQLVAATQMVVEEKFIAKYNVPPLQVVGNEGIWGVGMVSVLLVISYLVPGIRAVDNPLDAALQIGNSTWLLCAFLGSIVSIAFLNFFGISVTKYLSATHRTTIDATRVFLVWIISLAIGWEQFRWLQLGGFLVLLAGTASFNEIVKIPGLVYPPKASPPQHNTSGEQQPLLA